jgi:hypothetical protein
MCFVVVLGGTETLVTARVYTSAGGNPRLLEAEGPYAERDLAGSVLRHITDTPIPDVNVTVTSGMGFPEPDPLRTAATRLLQKKQYGEALELFRRAERETKGGDDDTLFNIATCLDALGRTAEAEQVLEQIYEHDPAHEEAGISLANHYLNQKKFGQAIAIYSRWTSSAKNGPLARYNLGIAYFQNGDLRTARQHLAMIPVDDIRYERAAAVIVEIDKRLPKTVGAKPATPKAESTTSVVLKYWAPLAVAIPILLLVLFRRRVRPSITVEIHPATTGDVVCVRNTSAGDVSVFDLNIQIFANAAGGEKELRSLTSDLSPDAECVLPLETHDDTVRVALAGVYYLFPKVRVGAFRFRRSVSLSRINADAA